MSDRGPTRRTVLRSTGAGAVVGLGAALGIDRLSTSRIVEVPLHAETVALDGPGSRVELAAAQLGELVPGTRVLASAEDAAGLVADERAWLASSPAWARADDRYGALARSALLDLRSLTLADGVHVAGWSSSWRYVWPRDSSHAAAALCATGHVDDALAIVRFLARVQSADGWFEARYTPDGAGPPDERPRQLDGTGWALWTAATVVAALPVARRATVAMELRDLVLRAVGLVLDVTSDGTALPPAGPDYWEVHEDVTTLGTAAPLVTGLRSAATLLTFQGDAVTARRAAAAATSLDGLVETSYGPRGYPRHLGGDDPDAAIAFLAPPYVVSAPARVAASLPVSERRMRRTAGGVAPGAGWKDDGISWTPETALLALAYAGVGRDADAWRLLDWLDRHRTLAGSLPEKVLWDGDPAAVAPLGWTASLVLLTLARLRGDR